ncbi:MAG: GntR family transcriptional regulator [Eubacteriales bacterium]|nr:GntR family transcriptional regulator [Eubacteriales bacterium]
MLIEIDFNSDEAIYQQLRNQIILGIATSHFAPGEVLPSVRQLADTIGINMHTVNKAYTVLKQEGFVKVDRRRGAVIAVDVDKCRAMEIVEKELRVLLAEASCRNLSREDMHALVDQIYDEYGAQLGRREPGRATGEYGPREQR